MTFFLTVNGNLDDAATGWSPDAMRDWARDRAAPGDVVEIVDAETGEIVFAC